jgi:hypothetical protein
MPGSVGLFPYSLGTENASTIDDTELALVTVLDGQDISSVASSRPSASKKGRVHVASDTGAVSYDTGSAWIQLYPRIPVYASIAGGGATSGVGPNAAVPIGSVASQSPSGLVTVASNIITVHQTGLYAVTAAITSDVAGGNTMQFALSLGGHFTALGDVSAAKPQESICATYPLTSGDAISLTFGSSSSGTHATLNYLTVNRIDS